MMRFAARFAWFVLLTAGVAHAQDACRADIEKLCGGVLQGDGRILTCLHSNTTQLSPACAKVVGPIGAKVKEIGTACGDDIYQYCPDVKVGGGRVLKCLGSNSTKLSPGCQKAVQQAEEKSAEFKKACEEDSSKFCKGVPRGQGRLLACLRSKETELSPACKTVMQPLLSMPAAAAAAPGAVAAPAAAAPAGATTGTAPAAPPAAAPAPGAPATPPPAAPPKK